MGLFDWIREGLTGERVCPPEHLESYKRLGEQVYELHVELAECNHPRALAFMQAARTVQAMADAMLGDAFSASDRSPRPVPIVTHEQADVWYGMIPDLMIAARQDAAFPDSARIALPVRMGRQVEGPDPCPVEHLAGLRRAAEKMEEMNAQAVESVRSQGDVYKTVILLYESARTRKQAGDAIVGSIANGRRVSKESHEDAEKQYWLALTDYLLIAQGLKAPALVAQAPSAAPSPDYRQRRCKLDSADIWKVTSSVAKREIIRSGEWDQAVEDLEEHWATFVLTEVEREYETTVEDLLARNLIEENGYWYCCPFPAVYRVRPSSGGVRVLGRSIPAGHVFVFEYGDDGAPGEFITAASFQTGADRKYCEDD
ncbi:hypothetical protein [Cohnella zeiphila]|uniref:Uncharacterized protein n=1 Tax=Cohnella zeiphila TaxID=2761120 RepID=A0A7X0SR12_9BACL|nr:hypothetical protein [Cohnella zeiphila]MBB6734547.1 hypothetical protein [Cohnella zeiphila]